MNVSKITLVVVAIALSLAFLWSASAEESSVKHLVEGKEMTDWKSKSEDYWKENLTPLQYRVCREAGTEAPFTGKYTYFKEDGVYHCSNCGQKLFSSESKFDSGSGWPSFTEAVEKGALALKEDRSHGMRRTEVVCSRCNAHLGHVFDDGPRPTGKRFCINSVCLIHENHLEESAE